jgi:hypothetical protein
MLMMRTAITLRSSSFPSLNPCWKSVVNLQFEIFGRNLVLLLRARALPYLVCKWTPLIVNGARVDDEVKIDKIGHFITAEHYADLQMWFEL